MPGQMQTDGRSRFQIEFACQGVGDLRGGIADGSTRQFDATVWTQMGYERLRRISAMCQGRSDIGRALGHDFIVDAAPLEHCGTLGR